MYKLPVIAALAATVTTSCTTMTATREPAGAEATILFADRNGIRDFEPVDDQTVYLRASDNKWYRAILVGACRGIQQKTGLAYITNPDGSFDRTSAIRVNGQRCDIQSLVESGPPPTRKSG